MHWAGGPCWLPDTLEVCETNIWEELNIHQICQCMRISWVPEIICGYEREHTRLDKLSVEHSLSQSSCTLADRLV